MYELTSLPARTVPLQPPLIGYTTQPKIWGWQLQRGVHRSTANLEADIAAFIAARNENPQPYKWGQIRRRYPRLGQTLLPKNNEPNFGFR